MQVWQVNEAGGFLFAPNLSDVLRMAIQPIVKFRQFCDVDEAQGLGRGATHSWNEFSDVGTEGRAISETEEVPRTGFKIIQNSLTVTEYANSIPYTKKLDDLSEQPVTAIINKTLKNDVRKVMDRAAWTQFTKTPLKARAMTDKTVQLTTNGTPGGTHQGGFSAESTRGHVKAISDEMNERAIPAFDGDNFIAISRTRNLRPLKDELEKIHQYTEAGWYHLMNGERGRYEGIRFFEQTNIAKRGSANSDDIFFFGQNTVIEAISIQEELRGEIPRDFGRQKGLAWYAVLGFGLNYKDAKEARVIHWTATDA